MNKKRLAEQIFNDLVEDEMLDMDYSVSQMEFDKRKNEIIEIIESRLRDYVMIDGNVML